MIAIAAVVSSSIIGSVLEIRGLHITDYLASEKQRERKIVINDSGDMDDADHAHKSDQKKEETATTPSNSQDRADDDTKKEINQKKEETTTTPSNIQEHDTKQKMNKKKEETTTTTPSNSQDHDTKQEITKKGPAIAMLISCKQRDVNWVSNALKSIDLFIPKDNMTTPVLLFNEGNLSNEQKLSILNISERPIHFPIVDFKQFPEGFNPETETSNFKKRSKWGYQQMCRFWITKIWEHPVLDDYENFMRFDSDSCFSQDLSSFRPYVPGMPSDTIVYGANNVKKEDSKYIEGLFDLAQGYVTANNITVKNPELWGEAKQGKYFYNNFELSRIDFFRRPDVMAFQRAVTDMEPFGVFRRRWGDAPVRLLTVAIFAEKTEVQSVGRIKGYRHPCMFKHHQGIREMHSELMANLTSTQRMLRGGENEDGKNQR